MEQKRNTHLAHQQRHLPPHELPHGPRVVVEISAREALVRAVEEHVVALREDDVRDLGPLLARGVDAGRVVRARVKEDDGALGERAQGVEEWLVGEPDRRGVVVGVRLGFDADVAEDGEVVDCGCIVRL